MSSCEWGMEIHPNDSETDWQCADCGTSAEN